MAVWWGETFQPLGFQPAPQGYILHLSCLNASLGGFATALETSPIPSTAGTPPGPDSKLRGKRCMSVSATQACSSPVLPVHFPVGARAVLPGANWSTTPPGSAQLLDVPTSSSQPHLDRSRFPELDELKEQLAKPSAASLNLFEVTLGCPEQ